MTIKTTLKSALVLATMAAMVGCTDDPKPKKSTPAKKDTTSQQQAQTDDSADDMGEEATLQELIPMESQPKDTKRGLYSYYADAALFTDCATNTKYPVAQEAIAAELKSTYLALREKPAQKMLIAVKGEFDERSSPDTDEDLTMLIPSELIGMINKDSCQ
ncbi:hypothetical protein [Kangiella shandongensis]|uniref:hypothetical protein n=1 Tax=Kangiella shandongensis TaxID=2763258 RepID=UPI001CBE591A|nr:hypothetical protein [Kangiella shandongensis]